METVAIISRKGGTGKTATAQALGAGLQRKGRKVLFVDMDSQANLSYSMGASINGASCMDLLTGSATAAEAIQHTKCGDIIAGSEELAAADMALTEKGKEYRLKNALAQLQYDYIIIDTPAALGTLTINALTAANKAIIAVQADVFSLQGMGQLRDTIDAVRSRCNRELITAGVLVTRYSGRAILSRDMLQNIEDAARILNTKPFKTPIRECIAVKEAQAQQLDIFAYAPKSNAAQDYEAFIKEFTRANRSGKQ